jgi:hypothetical protein
VEARDLFLGSHSVCDVWSLALSRVGRALLMSAYGAPRLGHTRGSQSPGRRCKARVTLDRLTGDETPERIVALSKEKPE